MYCIIVHCRHFFLADYKQYTQRLSTFRGLNINIWGMIIVQMGDDYRTNGGLNINIWGMGWRSCPSPSMLQVRAVRHRPVATLTSGGVAKLPLQMLRSTIINIWGMGWRSCPSPSMLQVRAVRHRPVATLTSGGVAKLPLQMLRSTIINIWGMGWRSCPSPSMLQVRAVRHRPVAPSLSYIWGRCEALHPRCTCSIVVQMGDDYYPN